jgi:LmbE family N-acetylglucosaminyl deacetylase
MKTKHLLNEFRWERFERVIVLSPHLDDAVFSCGGLLSALNGVISRLAITICCSKPPPREIDGKLGRSRSRRGHVLPKERRAEDVEAMSKMDCDYVHLGFTDAVFRRSPLTGQLTYRGVRDTWAMPRVDDSNFVEELFLILNRLCHNMGKVVLISPLGVGHHVDHVITAQVAQRLAGKDVKLLFYEDVPYVWDRGESVGIDDDPQRAMLRLGVSPLRRWHAPYNPSQKAKLINCYPTQVPSLFGDEKRMKLALKQPTFEGKPNEFYWETKADEKSKHQIDESHLD